MSLVGPEGHAETSQNNGLDRLTSCKTTVECLTFLKLNVELHYLEFDNAPFC